MSASQRRVVITGFGLVNPLGLEVETFWQALLAGTSGIKPITSFDTSGLSTRIAGELEGFQAKNFIDKKERKGLKIMARAIQMSLAGAQLAIDHSKLDKQKLDPTRFGVEFGAALLAMELADLGPAAKISTNCQPHSVDLQKWGTEGLPAIQPLWMLKYLPNMHACHISILHNAQGPSNSITESDVASLLALSETTRIIRRDEADVFLVGGSDSRINSLSMVRQCLFGKLSRRNDEPEKACRPFERHRDGPVLGEGAGVLVVEELEHARARGAHIFGEVVGSGAAFDRGCSGAGLARAIRNALKQAQITPADVDHISAHGLGSVDSDCWEARAITEVFGDVRPPVWALKSYVGNLGSGAGTTELAASLLSLERGVLPRTLNYEEPDPACPLDVRAEASPTTGKPYVLKVGFTEMGQCAAVVCKKWQE